MGGMQQDRFEVRPEWFGSPVVTAMIAEVQAEYVVRYGGPDDAPIDAEQFTPPNGLFCVGYLAGEPVAMGGFRRHGDGVVELKRMYVRADHRGRGLSRRLLAAIEGFARSAGARTVVLETGQRQPEALALYETSGYERIGGFGHYAESPLSVAMGKTLAADDLSG